MLVFHTRARKGLAKVTYGMLKRREYGQQAEASYFYINDN